MSSHNATAVAGRRSARHGAGEFGADPHRHQAALHPDVAEVSLWCRIEEASGPTTVDAQHQRLILGDLQLATRSNFGQQHGAETRPILHFLVKLPLDLPVDAAAAPQHVREDSAQPTHLRFAGVDHDAELAKFRRQNELTVRAVWFWQVGGQFLDLCFGDGFQSRAMLKQHGTLPALRFE